MSQPPAGGYPPPDQSQPGGYPPPAPGYQPPPAYNPPPGPAPGGYQPPPPAPGYAPPPGGYAPPPAAPGGYPPPAGGYQPPAGGYQPPAPAYGGPPAPAGGGMPSVDFSKITTGNWIVIGLGVLLLIFSFFGWVSSSYASIGGWNNWWFLIVLIELAVTVIYAGTTLGVLKAGPIKPVFLFYGAAAAFVLYIIALIQIFASYSYSASDYCSGAGLSGPSLSACQAASSDSSVGAGFGIWASIVLAAAFAYFIALWAQKTDKLPFKVPGPVL